jgi:hypothetical protein
VRIDDESLNECKRSNQPINNGFSRGAKCITAYERCLLRDGRLSIVIERIALKENNAVNVMCDVGEEGNASILLFLFVELFLSSFPRHHKTPQIPQLKIPVHGL